MATLQLADCLILHQSSLHNSPPGCKQAHAHTSKVGRHIAVLLSYSTELVTSELRALQVGSCQGTFKMNQADSSTTSVGRRPITEACKAQHVVQLKVHWQGLTLRDLCMIAWGVSS
eukprot:323260-Amphidinium_carterae.2